MALASIPYPVEIIDSVIDLLHDDKDTLKTCSLVAHTFTPRSRKHLFARVKLRYPRRGESQARVKELVGLITPELERYIQHLYIDNYAERFRFKKRRKNDALLPLLFTKLKNLQSFSLSLNRHDDKVKWLSSQMVAALVTMFNTTQVHEVNLHWFEAFPIALLAFHCPDIRRLNLDYCWNPYQRTAPTPTKMLPLSEDFGQLEVLVISQKSLDFFRNLYEATRQAHSRLTFACLQEVVIKDYSMEVLGFATKIAEAGISIRQITWDLSQSDPAWLEDLKFATLPSCLRSLSIAFEHRLISYDLGTSDPAPHFQGLCAVLDKNSGNNILEEIVLVLSVSHIPPDLDARDMWENEARVISMLDSLLGGQGYPHLRRVAIFVEYTCPLQLYYRFLAPEIALATESVPVTYFEAVVKRLIEKLPVLVRSGVLTVQWLITENYPLGLNAAKRAVDQGLQGGLHVGYDGEFMVGREYSEQGLHAVGVQHPEES